MIQGFAYPHMEPARDALFVLSAFGVGGSERKVARIATALGPLGVTAALCVLGPPYTLQGELPARIPVWTLDRGHRVSPRTVLRLRRVLRDARPRTVVAVDLFSMLYVSLALRSMGGSAARVQKVALINTTDFVRRRDRLYMRVYVPLLRHGSLVVFGSLRQREQWLCRYRLDGIPSLVVHNGVDARHFNPAEFSRDVGRLQCGIAANRFVIGTVGRLAPEKNQAALVRVVARLRAQGIDAHLLIVGEGPGRAGLLDEARRYQVADAVTLAGEVPDIRPLLAAMSVFALPSTSVETFSNAALEAMSMSLPVVLSDIGGAREMVRNGREGFIVPVGDDEALHRVLRLLCTDPALPGSMGRAARARVEKDFAFERMVARYRGFITGLPEEEGDALLPCK